MLQPLHALPLVDDAGADLDARRPGARYREQRHGRGRLAGDVVDASVGAVDADLVRPDRATAISTASLSARPASGSPGPRPCP
ncbi:hypothetical protein HMPREF1318_2290 [Actinomyces massiliensis F0489]|uniref:Uncharacterized protein n=1 Tax=Actinomyces massiliensis F0489 TaxID=1125718 RepID=J0NIU3_9ACTO|nr:hypothetical protein HMPREF1318_2290 [Actinomyces massiliensis F0489]